MIGSKHTWSFAFQIGLFIGCLVLSILAGQAAARNRSARGPTAQSTIDTGQMILIPAGTFIMGSDTGRSDEAPAHQVYLDSYWLDQFEVTNHEFYLFLQATTAAPPRYWEQGQYPIGQDLYPVVGVRWKDAQAYCEWAGKRLPTEAEWEKACRGTQGQIYPWGDSRVTQPANATSLPEGPQATMWEDAWGLLTAPPRKGIPSLRPVGSYPSGASPYGIHDLMGNASEWVADYYNWDGYWGVSTRNPLVLEPAWNHVVRGSAWLLPYGNSLGTQDLNRCAARSSSHGDTQDARMGFRCARSGDG